MGIGRGVALAVAVVSLCLPGRPAGAPGWPPRRHHEQPRPHQVRRACSVLLPRAAFPRGMTQWASERTTANSGAVASGFQQAHYRWGYILVTPDLYPTAVAARRRYQQASQLIHGGRRVRIRPIGQQTIVWVTGDQLTGYTVTTILLRAGTTVTEINIGAGGPVVSVATAIARAVSAHACH